MRFSVVILTILGFWSLPGCATERPAAVSATPGHQGFDLGALPDRLLVYDQAISDLKAQNSEIQKKIAALEEENSDLKKRLEQSSR